MRKTLLGAACVTPFILAGTARADDTERLRNAFSACYSGTQSCIVDLKGYTVHVSGTLTIDPLRLTLRNGTIDCRAMSSGTCLLVTNDLTANSAVPVEGATHHIDSIRLLGPGKGSNVDGITYNTTTSGGVLVANITTNHLDVDSFRHGIVYLNNTYNVENYDINVHDSAVGLYTAAEVTDSGERNGFFGGGFYNNVIGMDSEGPFEFTMQSFHLDYNQQDMIVAGSVEYDGHVENQPSNQPQFVLKALNGTTPAQISFSTTTLLLVNGYNGQPTSQCYVDTVNSYSMVHFPRNTYGVVGTTGPVCGPAIVKAWDYGNFVPQ